MKVSPEQIFPSQNFLKPRTIAYILECIANNEHDKLPPAPIVRKGNDGNLIAIDGHNLIAVKLHLGEDIDVHLATSSDDGLSNDSEANTQRNKDLHDKFSSVLTDRKIMQDQGIHTFQDLIDRYQELFQ